MSVKLSKGKILTASAVVVFVLVFFWGRYAEAAEVGVGLGFGTFNARGAIMQELSVTSDDYRWFASYTRIGKNDSNRLVLEQNDRFVVAYRTFWRRDKDVKPYLSLGAAYFTHPPNDLISDRLSYDLRLGFRWRDILEVDLDGHNSTAGRSSRNTGVDSINLRAVFRF